MSDMSTSADAQYGTGGGVLLRLFATMHVTGDAARAFADVGMQCYRSMPTLRPVLDDDVHMTFAWLGDVPEEYVPAIAAALDDAATASPGASGCTVSGVSAMGGGRALAAMVDVELIAALDAARDQFLAAVAAYAPGADRRPWRPHVTVARSASSGATEALIERAPSVSWVARELTLRASLPAPIGRQYRELHTTLLGLGTSEQPHA